MLDQVLGMEVIAKDRAGRLIVRDKAKRSYIALDNGKFIPLHANPSPPTESKWDTFWYSPIGQKERKP